MSRINRHIIQKIAVELTCDNESTGKRLYQDVSAYIQTELLPELSDYFDQLTPDGNHIRIDRIELDIGLLPAKGWEQVLKQQVVAQVRRQMETSGHFSQEAANRDEQKKTLEQNISEAYLYFLEYGYLPWWAATDHVHEIEQQLTGSEHGKALAKQLNLLFQSDYNALRRFVRQASDGFIRFIWKNIQLADMDAGILTGLKELFIKAMSPDLAKQWAWEAVFLSAVSRPQISGKMQIEAVLQVLLEKSDLLSRFPALKWETSHLKPNELPKAAAPTSGTKDTDTKGFYVEHAGIVLLSPFLPAFFDRIGLLKKQHFIDADKQESALLWLHYLCTGKKECPENETLLLKLLCGISPEQPIPKKLNVPAKKLEEAEFLLRTVVEHWPVLKNTSPDGLREGFLQRSGKLINHGGQWQLTVERRPQDILFDQLSWGFSVIKYPWMKEMLVVEW